MGNTYTVHIHISSEKTCRKYTRTLAHGKHCFTENSLIWIPPPSGHSWKLSQCRLLKTRYGTAVFTILVVKPLYAKWSPAVVFQKHISNKHTRPGRNASRERIERGVAIWFRCFYGIFTKIIHFAHGHTNLRRATSQNLPGLLNIGTWLSFGFKTWFTWNETADMSECLPDPTTG